MTPLLLLLLVPLPQVPANTLSALEREAGWELLFDGQGLTGWHRFGRGDAPQADGGLEVVDGCLHLPAGGKGGDLVTDGSYGDFELEFEWRVTPGANSGVKYRVAESEGAGSMLGPEYQVLDDELHPDGKAPITSAGSLYAVMPPQDKLLRPVGQFNTSRIVARGERIEHWLNGVRVVETTVGSPDWEERKARSKFAAVEGFGRGRGVIGLQDHGDEVWFRSIRVRDFEDLPGQEVDLFDGTSLAGWRSVGDARYVADEGSILGEVDGGGQSFLVTERSFGDFLLEVELKPELPGNSGIQVRSHQRDNGRVYGYQVEIDSSARAWSGGLYDEARRGWLDDLSDNEAARAAFRPGDWNHYRIECLGPWIRTWVNGVPAADHLDPLDLEGFLGLQVHSGNDTRVRWRNFRMRDLGTRAWMELRELPWVERPWSSDPRAGLQDLEELEEGRLQLTFTGTKRLDTVEAVVWLRLQHEARAPDEQTEQTEHPFRILVGTPSRRWDVELAPLPTSGAEPAAQDVLIWILPERLEIRQDGKPLEAGPGIPQERRGNSTFGWAYDGEPVIAEMKVLGPPG